MKDGVSSGSGWDGWWEAEVQRAKSGVGGRCRCASVSALCLSGVRRVRHGPANEVRILIPTITDLSYFYNFSENFLNLIKSLIFVCNKKGNTSIVKTN